MTDTNTMNNFILQTMLDAYDTVVIVNTKKQNMTFVKNDIRQIAPNTTMNVFEFAGTYNFYEKIHPEDKYLFDVHFSSSAFIRHLHSRENGLVFAYREYDGKRYIWSSIYMFVPDNYSKGDSSIIICRKILGQATADIMEMMELHNKKTIKVIKANIETREIRVVKQLPAEAYIYRKHTKNHKLSSEWVIEEELIYKGDMETFIHYTDGNYIRESIKHGADEITFFYRRKTGNLYKWVRATITRSSEYTPTNQVYTFILEDVHTVVNKLIADNGHALLFQNYESQDYAREIYEDNLWNVMSYLTQKYIDLNIIDLKHDLFINYKIRPETLTGEAATIGSFSQVVNGYIEKNKKKIAGDTVEHLMASITPDALRNGLKDKSSMELYFTLASGQKVRATCTKLESEHGIPTKVVCAVLPYVDEERLKVTTFGNFDVFDAQGERIKFTKKQSKQLLAYLIDKQGYPVTTKEIVVDVLEKEPGDKNALKYVSRLSQLAIADLEKAGFTDIIIKEWNSLRVNADKIDCDYYNLINGDASYMYKYQNEYMKEYSWAEETNAEILHYSNR